MSVMAASVLAVLFVLFVLLIFGLCRAAATADDALSQLARKHAEGETLDFKWPERPR